AICIAIKIEHRLRGNVDGAVALEASLALDLDRPSEIERAACRRVAFPGRFGGRRREAKLVDDVGLPIRRSIARIGRVERRFLVREVGVLFTQLVELLGCGEGWN